MVWYGGVMRCGVVWRDNIRRMGVFQNGVGVGERDRMFNFNFLQNHTRWLRLLRAYLESAMAYKIKEEKSKIKSTHTQIHPD